MNRLQVVAQTVWIGGLWVIGLLVAPVLFALLERSAAGTVAGVLFARLAWVGLVCGAILLIAHLWRDGLSSVREGDLWLVVAMLLCTAVNHFGVTPIIGNLKQHMSNAAVGIFDGGFATWHAISSLIYLLQSVLGLVYLLRQAR